MADGPAQNTDAPTQAGPGAGGVAAIIRALDERRLTADMNHVSDQLRAIARDGQWIDGAKHVLRASPELIDASAGLVGSNGRMTIMSLFRFGSPHGERQPDDSAIGRSVDIMAYGTFNIHLKNPANAPNAIAGVAAVIGHLPSGKYTLGLPRPGGGAKIDPPNDVFFSVTDHKQVTMSPGKGLFKRDLELLLEPARSAIAAAVAGNPGARIQFMYPDGVDHVHVKAVP